MQSLIGTVTVGGESPDTKELLEVNQKILESLESSRQILIGIAAVLVGEGRASSPPEFPSTPSESASSPTVGLPPRPPTPIYSETYAKEEESDVVTQTDEERVKIDLEQQLREMGIEIDDDSVPFPLPSEALHVDL
jgi:hypothetical protein